MIYLFLLAVLNKYSLKRRLEKKIPSSFQNERQKYEEMSREREEARFSPKEKDLGQSLPSLQPAFRCCLPTVAYGETLNWLASISTSVKWV